MRGRDLACLADARPGAAGSGSRPGGAYGRNIGAARAPGEAEQERETQTGERSERIRKPRSPG